MGISSFLRLYTYNMYMCCKHTDSGIPPYAIIDTQILSHLHQEARVRLHEQLADVVVPASIEVCCTRG